MSLRHRSIVSLPTDRAHSYSNHGSPPKNSIAHAAARAGRADLLQLLAEEMPLGLDLAAPNARGETPLQAALAEGHETAALVLLATGAGGHDRWPWLSPRADAPAPGPPPPPPLVLAAAAGLGNAVGMLLQQRGDGAEAEPAGVLAGARDAEGRTALHAAAARGHGALARRLARLWPEGLCEEDGHGQRPAEAAAAGGHPELAAALWRRMRELKGEKQAARKRARRAAVLGADGAVASAAAAPLAPIAPAHACEGHGRKGEKQEAVAAVAAETSSGSSSSSAIGSSAVEDKVIEEEEEAIVAGRSGGGGGAGQEDEGHLASQASLWATAPGAILRLGPDSLGRPPPFFSPDVDKTRTPKHTKTQPSSSALCPAR